MTLGVEELHRLSSLLDTAMDLEESGREAWLAGLRDEDALLATTLRKLLEQQALVSTVGLLERGPAFTMAAAVDEVAESAFHANELVGPYRLERRIGEGGMGEVWLAVRGDGRLKRQVALKLPMLSARRSVLVQRFARERDILASLTHPNIARLYDAGLATDAQPYLAMEYVEGQPITDYCDERKLDVRERVRLTQQVMDAVQHAHANLVIHRDLKPSNVLVNANGQAMLLDFGIAKLLQPEETQAPETELTQRGGRALTLAYAAPEQIAGTPVSIATDVWALGVLLYELLTGGRPFQGSRSEIEQTILTQEPAPLRQLPPDLATIVLKALKKAPTERYATVAAFADDLGRCLRGEPVLAQPDSRGYRLRRFAARHRAALLIAAMVSIMLVSAAGVSIRQAQLAREQASRAQAVQAFLVDLFRINSANQADPERARQITARQLLDAGTSKLDQALVDQGPARLVLLETLGTLYSELGLWSEAAELNRKRVMLARSLHGSNSPELASALVAHAEMLDRRDQDSTTEVVPLLNEARRILDRAGDDDSLSRARLLAISAAHWSSLSLTQALRDAERSVEIYRTRHGQDPGQLKALEVLATVLLRQGEFSAAADRLRTALALARQRRVPDVQLIGLLQRAGEVELLAARAQAAGPLLQEALTLSEQVNGARHGVTLVSRLALARQQAATGHSAAARRLAEQSLADALTYGQGNETFQLPDVRRQLIEVLWAQGDLPAVRAQLAEAFADLGTKAPASFQHADLIFFRAQLQLIEGAASQALATATSAAAMAKGLGLGPRSLLLRNTQLASAKARLLAGDAAGALALAQPLMLKPGAQGPAGVDAEVVVTVASAMADGQQGDAALQLLLLTLAEYVKAMGEVSPTETEAALQLALGSLRRATGNCAAAGPGLERAMRLYRELHTPQSPWRVRAEVLWALCLGVDRRPEAQAVLASAQAAQVGVGPLADGFLRPLRELRAQLGGP